MTSKVKVTARSRRTTLDHDRFDYWRVDLTMKKGVLPAFYRIANEDGMKPAAALEVLIQWIVTQGTIFPIEKASQRAAQDLQFLHKQLTETLRRLEIEAEDFEDGESWKNTES